MELLLVCMAEIIKVIELAEYIFLGLFKGEERLVGCIIGTLQLQMTQFGASLTIVIDDTSLG
jgi:hypothetical protein